MLQHPRHTEKALALGRPALDKQNQATITAKITNRELAKAVATGKNLAQLALENVSSEFEGGESLAKAGFMAALQHQMRKLDSGAEEQKAKAAEQLGTWAAVSDENRLIIGRYGAEALVALVVTGSEDAKWHAARALRNLANNPEAKKAILKADGVPTLTLVAKHGKGRVKEAADEALKLLSQDSTRPHPILEENKVADPEGDIPSGKGTRVAMFSARFDGGPIEQKFRKVFQILCDHHYDILMVAADAGESFGDLTTEYLGRLHEENGTMLAVCTKHYGEMTASAYSSHKELKFALDYENHLSVLPLRVDDTYPPEPPGGPDHKYDKKNLARKYILSVFKPCVVFLDCREKSEREIAAEIAKSLQKRKVAKDGSS